MSAYSRFTADELLILINFYQQFSNWRLIEKIIRIEQIEVLEEIIKKGKE